MTEAGDKIRAAIMRHVKSQDSAKETAAQIRDEREQRNGSPGVSYGVVAPGENINSGDTA